MKASGIEKGVLLGSSSSTYDEGPCKTGFLGRPYLTIEVDILKQLKSELWLM